MERSNERKARFPIFRDRLNILLGDMSTTDFADKVDVSRQTMGFYLNGDRIPDSLTLARICKVCSVSSDWLLGLTNDPKPRPCAADDLEISHNAIEAIICYTKAQKDGLNHLLECPLFKSVCDGISLYVNIPDTEKFGFPGEDNVTRFFEYESKQRELEEHLASFDNELSGKVKVLIGFNRSDYYRREILDATERLINSLQIDE